MLLCYHFLFGSYVFLRFIHFLDILLQYTFLYFMYLILAKYYFHLLLQFGIAGLRRRHDTDHETNHHASRSYSNRFPCQRIPAEIKQLIFDQAHDVYVSRKPFLEPRRHRTSIDSGHRAIKTVISSGG